MSVIHITNEQEFQEKVVQFTWLSVVDFRAERCGPCRMLGPVMEQLAEENVGKPVQIIKVNVDENQWLAQAFQVSSIPVVFFVQWGKVVDYVVGANPKTVYQEKIEQHGNKSTTEENPAA